VNEIMQSSSLIPESSINKVIVVKHNNLYYKSMYPNDMDVIIASIMSNRSSYETILLGHKYLTIDDIHHIMGNYVSIDYVFPNFNTIVPFVYDKQKRLEKIVNMYFKRTDTYWFYLHI